MNIAHTHNTTDCQARSNDELKNKRTTTYFDTGAAASICCIKPSKLNRYKTGKIVGVTGNTLEIEGEGTIQMQDLSIPGTAYVPDLEFNLVSGTQLIKQGSFFLKKNCDGIR
jgi:hypothetical protein